MERFLSLAGALAIPTILVLLGYRRWRARWYTEDVKLLTMTSEVDPSDGKTVVDLRLYDERGFDQIVRNPFRRHYWGYIMFIMATPWLGFILGFLFNVKVRQAHRAIGLHNAWRQKRNLYLIPREISRDVVSMPRMMGSRDDKTARAVKSDLVEEVPFWAVVVVCQGIEGCCIRIISAVPEEWEALLMCEVPQIKISVPRNILVSPEKVQLPEALLEAAHSLKLEFYDPSYICNGSSVGHEVKVPIPVQHLEKRRARLQQLRQQDC